MPHHVTAPTLVLFISPIQGQHGQYDSCLAFTHIELYNGTRIVYEVLCNLVLGRSDLKLSFNFKHKPLRVLGRIPGALHL
jgi:hypothetical protein